MPATENLSRLREFRTRRGWSQERIAQQAGVSAYTISRIERGVHEPNRSTKRAIAWALGYRIEVVFPEAPQLELAL